MLQDCSGWLNTIYIQILAVAKYSFSFYIKTCPGKCHQMRECVLCYGRYQNGESACREECSNYKQVEMVDEIWGKTNNCIFLIQCVGFLFIQIFHSGLHTS